MRFDLSSRLRGSISLRIASLFRAHFRGGVSVSVLGYLLRRQRFSRGFEQRSDHVEAARKPPSSLRKAGSKACGHSWPKIKNKVVAARFMVRVLDASGETLFLKPSVQERNTIFTPPFRRSPIPALSQGWHALSAINDEDKFDFLTGAGPRVAVCAGGNEQRRSRRDSHRVLEVFAIAGASFDSYQRRTRAVVRAASACSDSRSIGGPCVRSRTVTSPGVSCLVESRAEMRDLGETLNGNDLSHRKAHCGDARVTRQPRA